MALSVFFTGFLGGVVVLNDVCFVRVAKFSRFLVVFARRS